MDSNPTLHLYYNELTDQLGIAAEEWPYVCVVRFVPYATLRRPSRLVIDYKEAFKAVPHETVANRTQAWVLIGDF